MNLRPLLAVIPARGGSKGLPGKNLRQLAGLPLIAHSIRCAGLCPEIDRTIISTDDARIAQVARQHGADVPFLRPAHLAQDDTPMLAVLQHAWRECERLDAARYESLLLLDPTSPGRLPKDVAGALRALEQDSKAVGVIAVSEPSFNPRWVCVEEQDDYMRMAFSAGKQYVRRQDVPRVYRINGLLYLWRRDYLLQTPALSYDEAPHRMWVVPEERTIHIDELRDLQLAELMLRSGMVELPWLEQLAREPKR
jgi:CMP-N,N'-diacetyllegionaminic acid synthase